MTQQAPRAAWKHYTGKELSAEFEVSAQELAKCAAEGLILAPAPRQKGPPYSQMDHLRLGIYKRCIQAGYGLNDVLDLIGRIHRRTAPVKTLILAKAYADDKLSDLKEKMAGGDTLELVNLRCDLDILKTYIDDLTRLQKEMGAPVVDDGASSADVQSQQAPKNTLGREAPKAASQPPKPPVRTTPAKRRPRAQGSYPRTYGSLADDSRQLWKRATPGGRMGWAIILACMLAIVGGYLVIRQPDFLRRHISPPPPVETPVAESAAPQPEPVESDLTQQPDTKTPQKPVPPTAAAPPKKVPAASKKSGSLAETAASDLKKIMAASGETAGASGDGEVNTPRVIRIDELVVFYDTQSRLLRAKVELLKNLTAQAPNIISGHIFIVLKAVGDNSKVITLPRIPYATNKWSDFAKNGVPFSLADHKTLYLKTQLSKQPPRQQQLTVYLFDKKLKLLLRESHIVRIKLN